MFLVVILNMESMKRQEYCPERKIIDRYALWQKYKVHADRVVYVQPAEEQTAKSRRKKIPQTTPHLDASCVEGISEPFSDGSQTFPPY